MTSKGHALSRDALIRTLTAYSGITTADGAFDGTATLIDSNLIGRNDFIKEKTILIMSGDAKDEDKGATDFDNTDGKITLQGTGFSQQIKAGTIFRVLNISSIEIDVANIATDIDTLLTRVTAAVALEATLTAIKGAGWTTETLKAIKDAIDAIAGVNTYQEQIPDTDFALALIDDELTADPPNADAENSVVDIDAIADPATTFVLRSLWVNITSFGTTGGTKLTFSLWVPINGVITEVDSVEVSSLGIQNLMDLFTLQEVYADSIHITVVTDATDEPGNAACSGTWKYAKAS